MSTCLNIPICLLDQIGHNNLLGTNALYLNIVETWSGLNLAYFTCQLTIFNFLFNRNFHLWPYIVTIYLHFVVLLRNILTENEFITRFCSIRGKIFLTRMCNFIDKIFMIKHNFISDYTPLATKLCFRHITNSFLQWQNLNSLQSCDSQRNCWLKPFVIIYFYWRSFSDQVVTKSFIANMIDRKNITLVTIFFITEELFWCSVVISTRRI